jgi:hypothetical protein
MDPFYSPPDNLPQIHCDPILPSTPWSSMWSLSFWLSHKNFVHFPLLSLARIYETVKQNHGQNFQSQKSLVSLWLITKHFFTTTLHKIRFNMCVFLCLKQISEDHYYHHHQWLYSPCKDLGRLKTGGFVIYFRYLVGLLWTSDQAVAKASTYTEQHNI